MKEKDACVISREREKVTEGIRDGWREDDSVERFL